MLDELNTAKKFVGIKQSLKAIEKDIVLKAFIAKDADPAITSVLAELCEKKSIPVEYADTMQQLGAACNIKIGAAVAVKTI